MHNVEPSPAASAAVPGSTAAGREVTRLRDLSSHQWKSGIAAWLGWLFDGLDMHLYILVATPFVAELLGLTDKKDPRVGWYSSWIQAAFLIGWALGGGFFGRIGDRLGRSRALMLTILTYALFTGLSFLAQTWWQLLIFRFLAALGIGGEWAVGASLLSETWPRRWRPWVAAVLQSGVNIGVLLACVAGYVLAIAPPRLAEICLNHGYSGLARYVLFAAEPRCVFLIGILPAFLTLWIRKAVPEPEEWHAAKTRAAHHEPGVLELFRGGVRRTTILTIIVCAASLSAHWAFMFWYLQHVQNLPELASWTDAQRRGLVSTSFAMVMAAAIVGNFIAGAIARVIGYRRAIALLCLGYFLAMAYTYSAPRSYHTMLFLLPIMGITQGVFGLFTMYLPPLFPTLLRTTGAGFCYNIGRIAAAFGTVFFGLFSKVGDYRIALFYAGFLFLPAAGVALLLPEPPDEVPATVPAPVATPTLAGAVEGS